MSNVIAFTPRPRPPEPEAPLLARPGLRAHLEEAAQTALDAADKIIAALDRLDEAPVGIEEAKPAVGPESQEEFRDTYARPRETATSPAETDPKPEPVPQEAAMPEPKAIILPWRGAGNVVSAAGCAVLALIGMRA
jgi:hypothetical protein